MLLADHLIRGGRPGTYATTIVSSSLLGSALRGPRGALRGDADRLQVDRAGGADDLAYGYEEALGYCVLPDAVRDKDGISAALLVADLAAALKADGRTLPTGWTSWPPSSVVHATAPLTVRVDRPGRDRRPRWPGCGPRRPTALLDRRSPRSRTCSPDADVVRLRADGVRVVVRPSGTEPKLKAYLEVVVPVPDAELAARSRPPPGPPLADARARPRADRRPPALRRPASP